MRGFDFHSWNILYHFLPFGNPKIVSGLAKFNYLINNRWR